MNVISRCLVRQGARTAVTLAFVLISMCMTPPPTFAQNSRKNPVPITEYGTVNGIDHLTGIDPSKDYRAGGNETPMPGDNKKVLYFYNIGTKKFLSIGGLWGTHASINSTPYSLWLESNDENATSWYVHSGVEGSGTGHLIGVQSSNVWMDKSGDYACQVTFEKADGYTDSNKLYHVKLMGKLNQYLTTYPDNEQLYCNQEQTLYATSDTRYNNQVWKIITREEYYLLALANPANMEDVIDCSFIMQAPDFRVNDIKMSNWTVNVPDTATVMTSDVVTKKVFFGDNTQYCTYDQRDNSGSEHFVGTYNERHQQNYGKLSYAYSRGASGYWLYQVVNVHKAGWYLLRCNGFTTQTVGTGTAERPAARLFMSILVDKDPEHTTDQKGSSATLNLLSKDYAAQLVTSNEGSGAGQAFFEGKYENQVQLCLDKTVDGADIDTDHPVTLRLGIYVEGNGAKLADDELTCVDNFKLLYAGPRRNPELILDEDNDHLLYLSEAKDEYKNTMLHLRRTLNPHMWNSLILPVDLNWGQMKRTFGDQVKVAKLERLSGSTIQFVTVTCKSNDDVMVKAFEPYIVYPPFTVTSSPSYTAEKFYTREGDDNAHWLNADCSDESTSEDDHFSLTIPKNHYVITMVTFDRDAFLKHVPKENWISDTKFSAEGEVGKMECLGTMAKTFDADGVIDGRDKLSGDYIFYKGDIVQVPHNKEYGLKAFRCWFELNGTHDIYHPKAAEFYLDGVKQTGVTGIDQIHGHEVFSARQHRLSGVYNLEGQRVSASSSTAGLPKGIYIIDGKKIILK